MPLLLLGLLELWLGLEAGKVKEPSMKCLYYCSLVPMHKMRNIFFFNSVQGRSIST